MQLKVNSKYILYGTIPVIVHGYCRSLVTNFWLTQITEVQLILFIMYGTYVTIICINAGSVVSSKTFEIVIVSNRAESISYE